MRRKVPDYNPQHALRRTPLSGVAPRVLKPSLLALHLHPLFCIWDQRPQFSCLRPCLLFLQRKRAWPLFEAKEIFPDCPTPVSFFEGYAPTEFLSQFLPVLINHMPGYQLENETQVWFIHGGAGKYRHHSLNVKAEGGKTERLATHGPRLSCVCLSSH